MGRQSAVEMASGSPRRAVARASPWPAKPPRSARSTAAPWTCLAKAAWAPRPRGASSGVASGPNGGRGSVGRTTPGKCRVVNRCGSPCSSSSREVRKRGGSSCKRGTNVVTRSFSHDCRSRLYADPVTGPMTRDAARVRRVNARPESAGGDYVLYWMQAARRLDHNHALDHALAESGRLGKPVVVYEGLRLDYPWASLRLHRFILEGMQANAQAAEALGLDYWPWVERRPGEGRGLLAGLAARAALVVTDDFPCFIVPGQTEALAARVEVAVVAVDTGSVVPLSRLGATVSAAAHLRPRIHRAFAEAWEHRAAARPRVPATATRTLAPPFEPAPLADLDALIETLPVDRSVPPVAAT